MEVLQQFVRRNKGLVKVSIVVLIVSALVISSYSRVIPSVTPNQLLQSQYVSGNQNTLAPNVSWSPYGEQSISMEGLNLTANYGNESPLPTASIAKVMTALALLKKMPISLGQQGPSLTISAADVATYQNELAQNESVVQVSVGEQITEYQLLQAMLIPSGTNIADSAAVWAFGSVGNYLAYANQYASQLGMQHSTFSGDASGFSPETVSTPQDLVKLGEAAVANLVIAQIVEQSSIELPVAGTLQNFDTDLGVDGIIGIKTGNTDQAGGAFLFAAKYRSQLLIGAIMGAPDLGTALHDAPEVLTSFESQLSFSTIVNQGQIVATYTSPWGGKVSAIAQKTLSEVDWQDASPTVQISLRSVRASDKAGSSVGAVVVDYSGSQEMTPVVLQKTVPGPGLIWRVTHL